MNRRKRPSCYASLQTDHRWNAYEILRKRARLDVTGDGEILLCERGIMRGYYGLPDETRMRQRTQ